MEVVSVPIILVICYMLAEIFKAIFKNKKEIYKLIPILVSMCGGLLGVIIYLTVPEMILKASNIWNALLIGIISGASSTTTNQIVKQLFKKERINEVSNHE